MKPLIDGDILLYECGFAAEYKDEDSGEKVAKAFEDAAEILDRRIEEICEAIGATDSPLLFLTGDERLLKDVNRQRGRSGEAPLEWKPNFRFEVAKSTPYKERKGEKPFHYYNLRAYVLFKYEVSIYWGMEADDGLAIYTTQSEDQDCCICSRDKDLRMIPGWHYGWECGNQPEFGPELVDEIGWIDNKGKGVGLKFFYAQLIMGDKVDTIPGLPGGGPAKAYKTLASCETEEEMYEKVSLLYEEKIGPDWFDYFTEQANLLWMVREVSEEGDPILFVPPIHRQVS